LCAGHVFNANDLAFDVFAFRGLDFNVLAVDLVFHLMANDEVGCIYGIV